MKEFKGTPAPWNIDTCPVNGLVITNSDESKALAFLPINGDDSQANSKLVAAAPELLKALQDCVNAMENGDPNEETTRELWSSIIVRGNKAITKALGETPIQTP